MNDEPPTLIQVGDYNGYNLDDIVYDDAGENFTIELLPVSDNKGYALTYLINNSDESSISASIVDHELLLLSLPGQYGTTDISVTATNNADESVTDTFTVTVNSVNDAPSFALGTLPQSISVNAGPQSLDNVAVDLSAGPENEL